MLSCGALERSNNLYIESIVGPCFSDRERIRKRSLLCGLDFDGNPEKGSGYGKKYPWAESGIWVLVC